MVLAIGESVIFLLRSGVEGLKMLVSTYINRDVCRDERFARGSTRLFSYAQGFGELF